ncbi:MAG: hypothetical protein ACREMF_11575 [Gemmatimonadales bacterium]
MIDTSGVTGRAAVAERLRFQAFGFDRLAGGHCHARVQLSWIDGREFVGESEGVTSPAGELRCSAEAAIRALEQAVLAGVVLELLGVKAVRAFDATVVIVSLSVRLEETAWQMVGSYLTETDPPRAAALAVLNATNRVLGNYVTTR